MGEAKRPVLSISLLTSHRKDTIRKCLDSLQPLRDAVASELIIVDTGCDGEMRGIIEEYTDKIVKFEWCDDFAKARNAGLKLCTGEWFMFLDDDECFIDTDEIALFFTSGMFKKYQAAYYIQRNYLDFKGREYQDARVLRLVKRIPQLHFKGIVHESFVPVPLKRHLCRSLVKHFGYCYKNEEERNAHSRRNITLLEKEIDADRNNMRMRVQMLQEYMILFRFEEAAAWCVESLKLSEWRGDAEAVRDRGSFYVGLMLAALGTGDATTAVSHYESALKDRRLNGISRAALYRYGAKAYFEAGDYEKSASCGRAYFRSYEKLKGKEDEWLGHASIYVYDAFDERNIGFVKSYLICSGLKLGSTENLKRYFDTLGWGKVVYGNADFVDVLVEAFAALPYEEYFVHCMERLLDGNAPEIAKDTMERIQELDHAASENLEKEQSFRRLMRVLTETNRDTAYIRKIRMRYLADVGDVDALTEQMQKLISGEHNFFSLDDEIWEAAQKGGVPLESLFFNIPFRAWRIGTDLFCVNNPVERLQKRKDQVLHSKQTDDVRYDYFDYKILETVLILKSKQGGRFEELTAYLDAWTDSCLALYAPYFTERAYLGEREFLPNEADAALRIQDMLELKKAGRHMDAFRALKDCMGIYRTLDKTLAGYAKLYRERLAEGDAEKLSREQPVESNAAKLYRERLAEGDAAQPFRDQPTEGNAAQPETPDKNGLPGEAGHSEQNGPVNCSAQMAQLAEAVKGQIENLIAMGEYDGAADALMQLKKLVPQDARITGLEEELARKMRPQPDGWLPKN